MEYEGDTNVTIFSLTIDIFSIVLSFMNYTSIYSVLARTCKFFQKVTNERLVVESILKREFRMEKLDLKLPKRVLMMKHRACTILQNVLLRKTLIPYAMAFYACRGLKVCDIYRRYNGMIRVEDEIEKLVYGSEHKITMDGKMCCTKEWNRDQCIWAALVQGNLSYLLFDHVIIEKASDSDGDNISVVAAARSYLIYIRKWTAEQEADYNKLNSKPFLLGGRVIQSFQQKQANALFPDKATQTLFSERNFDSILIDPIHCPFARIKPTDTTKLV